MPIVAVRVSGLKRRIVVVTHGGVKAHLVRCAEQVVGCVVLLALGTTRDLNKVHCLTGEADMRRALVPC